MTTLWNSIELSPEAHDSSEVWNSDSISDYQTFNNNVQDLDIGEPAKQSRIQT